MVTTKTNGLFDRLRAKGLCSQAATDGDLLTCFIDQNDSAAFEALVRRHGPMILGVCQRLLRNDADAQDAVQATFLVLVRKAKSIRRRDGLACWLYGVAHNTALKARAMSRLRHAKERQAGSSRFESGPIGRENALEQQLTNLDLELRQLPLHYRSPIILCDLEGQTLQEAANALGCPFGTVASRLARGRALLAKRLSRHGVMFSVGSLVSALAANRASASLPCQVLSAIVHSGSAYAIGAPLATSALTSPVFALTEGVLKMMLLRKLRNAILASIAVGICCTAAGTAMFARFPASAAPAPKAEPAPQKKPVLANAFADDPSFPYLLQNPAVIAELKLTDEQKEKIVESFVPLAKEFAMPPPIKPADLEQLKILQKVVDARIAKVFQELSKTVLTPEQLNRLCQIGLQMHGPEFYSNEKAAQILKLSDDQKKKVVVIIEDYRNANQLWLKADGGGILSPETVGRLERISKDASVKFSRLLNNHQQAIWKEFIGREVSLGKMILRNPDDEVQKPR